ncbi:RcnB family protein [Pinirhizobacter sp.]|jgi:Ni/Co efflux regulator RcnB|uniref:RcnB family protein n=1 Tax=Pinirhizobacter sp. TaxID=2950432 RepID=UPI002F402D3C
MNRLTRIAAAVVLGCASLSAFAQHDNDRGRDHGRSGHDDRRGNDHRGNDHRGYDHRGGYGHRPPARYYGHPHYYGGHPGPYRGHWVRGHRYNGPVYVVNNYGYYRLRPPPRGYHWVRNGSDYLLVAVATGIILDMATR